MLRTPPQRCRRRECEAICHLSFARSSAYLERRVVLTLYTLIHYYTHPHTHT